MDTEAEVISMENEPADQDEQICDLCKISYSTEQELRDHIWSFMHHIKLEQKKKGSVHHCNLCFTTCPNIIEYGKHLNGEKHKKAVEEGRRQTEEENMTSQKEALLNKMPREEEEKLPMQLIQSKSMETDGNMSDPEVSRRHQDFGNHYRSGKGHQRSTSQPYNSKLKWKKKDKNKGKERRPGLYNPHNKIQYNDDVSGNFPWQQQNMYPTQYNEDDTWWQNDVPSWNHFNQQSSFHNYWENPENFVPPEFHERYGERYFHHRGDFRRNPSQQVWQHGDFNYRFAGGERFDQENPRFSDDYNRWQNRYHSENAGNNRFSDRGNREFSEDFCDDRIRGGNKQHMFRADMGPYDRYQDSGVHTGRYTFDRGTEDATQTRTGHLRPSVQEESESGNFKRRRGNDVPSSKPRKEVRFDLPLEHSADDITNVSPRYRELKSAHVDPAHPSKRTKYPSVRSNEADSTTNTDLKEKKAKSQKYLTSALDRKKIEKKKKKKALKKSSLEVSFEENSKPAKEGLSILEKAEKLCKELREKREQAKKEKDRKEKQNKMSKTDELNSQIKNLEEINKGYVKGHLSVMQERMEDMPVDTNVCENYTSKNKPLDNKKDDGKSLNNDYSHSGRTVTSLSKAKSEHAIDEIRQEIESSVKSGKTFTDKLSLSSTESRTDKEVRCAVDQSFSEKAGSTKFQSSKQNRSIVSDTLKTSSEVDKFIGQEETSSIRPDSPPDPNSEVTVSSSTDNRESFNKENLLKLVNSPRSRKERQSLAEMLRSYAASKTRLSLPRFNTKFSDLTDGLEDVNQELRLEDLSADVQLQIAQLIEQDLKPDMATLERTLFSSDLNSTSDLDETLLSTQEIKQEHLDSPVKDLNETFLGNSIESSLDRDIHKTSRNPVQWDLGKKERSQSQSAPTGSKSSSAISDSEKQTSDSIKSKPYRSEIFRNTAELDSSDGTADKGRVVDEATALIQKYLNTAQEKDRNKLSITGVQKKLFADNDKLPDLEIASQHRAESLYGRDLPMPLRMNQDANHANVQSSFLRSDKTKTSLKSPVSENTDMTPFSSTLKQEPSEVIRTLADLTPAYSELLESLRMNQDANHANVQSSFLGSDKAKTSLKSPVSENTDMTSFSSTLKQEPLEVIGTVSDLTPAYSELLESLRMNQDANHANVQSSFLGSDKAKTSLKSPVSENTDMTPISSTLKQEPSEVIGTVSDLKPTYSESLETNSLLKVTSPLTVQQKTETNGVPVTVKQEPADLDDYFTTSFDVQTAADSHLSNRSTPNRLHTSDFDRSSKNAGCHTSGDKDMAEKAVCSGASPFADDFSQPADTALTLAALQGPAVTSRENSVVTRPDIKLEDSQSQGEVTGNLYSQSMVSSVSSTDSLFFDTVYDLSVQEEDIRKQMMTTGAEVTRLSQVIQEASEQLRRQKSKLKELAEKEETLRGQRIRVLKEAKQMQNSSQFGSSVDTISSVGKDVNSHLPRLQEVSTLPSAAGTVSAHGHSVGYSMTLETSSDQHLGSSQSADLPSHQIVGHLRSSQISSNRKTFLSDFPDHSDLSSGKPDTLYASMSPSLLNSDSSLTGNKDSRQVDTVAPVSTLADFTSPEDNIRISSVFSMACKSSSKEKRVQPEKDISSNSGRFSKSKQVLSHTSGRSSRHKKSSKHKKELDSSSGPFLPLEPLTDSSDLCGVSANTKSAGVSSPVALKDKKKDRKIYETLPPPLEPTKNLNTSFTLSEDNSVQNQEFQKRLTGDKSKADDMTTTKSTELREAGFVTLKSLLNQAPKETQKDSLSDSNKHFSASGGSDSSYPAANSVSMMDPIKTLNMFSSPTSSGKLNIQYMGSIPSSEDSPLSSPTTSKLNMQLMGGLPHNVLVVGGGAEGNVYQKLQSMFKGGDVPPVEARSTQSSSGDTKMELDCKSESSFKSDEIVLETDSNYESAGMASNAESLGEKIKKYCNSNDKKGSKKGKKGSYKGHVSDSGSDRTLKDEASNSDLASTPLSQSEVSRMKNCKVVLDNMDKDPVATALFTSPETQTLSPSRKRRKTKKQRDKTSVRKQKEEFILPSSSDGSSDDEEPISGQKQQIHFEVSKAAGIGQDEELCLVETGSDDMDVKKHTGIIHEEVSENRDTDRDVVNDRSQDSRRSLLDEVELDTESDIGTPPRGLLSERFKLRPEVLATVRETVRRSITTEEEIVRMEGPSEPVAALQLVGRHVVVAYQNSDPQKFDLETGECVGVFDCQSHRVCCLSVVTVKHSSLLYTGGPSKIFFQFDFDRMNLLRTEVMEQKIQAMLTAWARIYIGTDTGDVIAKSVQNGRTFDVFHCSSQPITCIAAATEGMRKVILVAAFNSPIYVCDATSGLLLRVMASHSKNSTFFSISVDGHVVYGGSGDKTLKKYNLLTGELIHAYECQGIVTGTASSPNQPYVYCAGYDRVIRCFHKTTHQLHCQYYGADFGTITTLALEENKILTGSRDGVVEVLNTDPGRVYTCKCTNCGVRFGAKQHLFHHLKTQHINNTRVFRCKWEGCTERMSTTGDQKYTDVDTHLRSHIEQSGD